MILAINARYLSAEKMDGIGWFTHETVAWIAEHNPGITFHLFVSSALPQSFHVRDNIVVHRLGPPTKHALLNLIWFEWSVTRVLKQIKPDLFVSLDGILPLRWKGPQYSLIHDLNFMHIPTDFKPSNRYYYRWVFPRSAKRAARIGTVSGYSKADIANTFGISPDKIDLVYSASKSDFRPVPADQQVVARARLTSGAPYFIFVGTLIPRKNILRLMQAFEGFKERTSSNAKLVLAGLELYKGDALRAQQREMKWGADVVFAGRVEQKDLNDFIGSALAMTFVSYFEGFGVPVLEAMACGIPVICSNVTSMPEVVGEAALLVDPYDVNQIADAMVRIATDLNLRQDLIAKGFEQKKKFTWDASASALWQSISKCLEQTGKVWQ